MVLQRRDQHLARQREEALLEAPGEGRRPLHQRGHLVEQRLADERATPVLGRERRDARADQLAAAREIGDHAPRLLEASGIARRRGERDLPRRHEAMAARAVAGGDAEQCRRHDVPAEHQHDPVHRAHEFRAAAAPAHALGDRQPVERGLHDASQQRGGRGARPDAGVIEELALRLLDAAELGDGRAAGLGERGRGAGRRAIRRERRADRGALALQFLVRLVLGDAAHEQREPARCGVALDLAVADAGGGEAREDAVTEGGGQGRQGLRRQLLGADLDQQVARAHAWLPAAGAPSGGSTCGTTVRAIGKPSASRLL